MLNLGEHFQTEAAFRTAVCAGTTSPDSLRIRSSRRNPRYVNAKANKAYYYSIDVKDPGDAGTPPRRNCTGVLGSGDV